MAPETGGAEINIEPFDPARHDRTAFSCGIDRLDNYLRLSARKHQEGDFARIFVAVMPGSSAVLGYYALNAHSVDAQDLPQRLVRHAPRRGGVLGSVPAAYLSMIAVDQASQGNGLGVILLADALKRLIPLSDEIGLTVVVLDVFDDDGPEPFARRKRFYERMGFMSFDARPERMFLPMKDIRKAFEKAPG